MNGSGIRAGLVYLLDTITGLRCYAELPDEPELPAAAVATGDPFIDYPQSFARSQLAGQLSYSNWEVIVVATRGGNDPRAQRQLDGFVFESIPTALYGDLNPAATPGGCLFAGTATPAAESIVVQSASGYRPMSWNGLDLMSCRISLRIGIRHS